MTNHAWERMWMRGLAGRLSHQVVSATCQPGACFLFAFLLATSAPSFFLIAIMQSPVRSSTEVDHPEGSAGPDLASRDVNLAGVSRPTPSRGTVWLPPANSELTSLQRPLRHYERSASLRALIIAIRFH
jgi:hypothetical protein